MKDDYLVSREYIENQFSKGNRRADDQEGHGQKNLEKKGASEAKN